MLESSPLPKLVMHSNDIPNDLVLALLDCDGTLTKPGRLVLDRFVEEVTIGSEFTRKNLKSYLKKWEMARRTGVPSYPRLLTDTGDYWAEMLEDEYRPNVLSQGKKWFEKRGVKSIMPYSRAVVKAIKDIRFRPVMVTGAPYEIAVHYARHLGIEYLFAMTAEVDENECYTGVMKLANNTGLGPTKRRICAEMRQYNQKILFAMGDTPSDMGLFQSAIERRQSGDDGFGRAVLINPRPEIKEAAYDWVFDYIDEKLLVIIERGTESDDVVGTVRELLKQILENNYMRSGLREQIK